MNGGDRTSLCALVELVYPELRKIARRCLRPERSGHVLQPTALVNEAYVRLAAHRHHNWQSRAHFFGAAARLMRRILVDYARAASAQKRGGGRETRLAGEPEATDYRSLAETLAVDEALRELTKVSLRQARVVELRYFGGMTVPEVAEALGTTSRTVERDWAAARAWLRRKLRTVNDRPGSCAGRAASTGTSRPRR